MSITLLVVAGGALVGALAALASGFRTAAQPTGADAEAERALIGAVLTDPSLYRFATLATADDFTWGPHVVMWEALGDLAVDDPDPDHRAEAATYDAPAKTILLPSDQVIAAMRRTGVDDDEIDAALAAGEGADRSRLLDAGGKVMSASGARELAGWDEPVPGTTFAEPLVRVRRPASPKRIVVSMLLSAGVLATLHEVGTTGWALAAAAVLLGGSVLAALVDLDTLYVDYVSVGVLAAAIGVAAVAAVDADELGVRALSAALVSIGIVATFEIVAWLWTKIRGQVGLGGGDSIILLPTLAVPILATGLLSAALWGLVAGMLLSVTVQVVLIVAGKASRDTPFPLVPYLLAGWPIGWALAVASGAV